MNTAPKTLVVDDSAAIVKSMVEKLNSLGITDITVAPDGMKALELFKNAILGQDPYRLVFLDLVMPVMDGHAVLKIMRTVENQIAFSCQEKIAIIITTSRNSPDDMIEAIHGECNDYIIKPVDTATLQRIIAKHIAFCTNANTAAAAGDA
ncbi:MAG TPA: response regulator [Deltaproteobacteria bacterium]|nr:response regulator [Deltaproteobacteria bacterium]